MLVEPAILPPEATLKSLGTTLVGLTDDVVLTRRARYGLALTMVMLPLALAPGLAVTLAGPLTAHGITIG